MDEVQMEEESPESDLPAEDNEMPEEMAVGDSMLEEMPDDLTAPIL